MSCDQTYILERDLFNANPTKCEVKGLIHALNVAGQVFIANVVVQLTRMESQIKSDLQEPKQVTINILCIRKVLIRLVWALTTC